MSDSFVYFIASGRSRVVKIGVANNPETRMAGLQCANAQRLRLLAQVPGDERYEKALHRAFSEYRIRGEWFRLEGRLATFIGLLPSLVEAPRPLRRAPKPALPAFDHRAHEQFCAEQLGMIRRAVLDIGVKEFCATVGARYGDMVRVIHGGGRFAIEWFLHLLILIPSDQRLAILDHLGAYLGFRVMTPEREAADQLAREEMARLRASVIEKHGAQGQAMLDRFDADMAAEEAAFEQVH